MNVWDPLILQMIGCLLVAATIGLMMGWLLRSFATSEKRQQLSEIATRLRGREHELDTLNHEVEGPHVRRANAGRKNDHLRGGAEGPDHRTWRPKVEQLTALRTEVREKVCVSMPSNGNATPPARSRRSRKQVQGGSRRASPRCRPKWKTLKTC